MRACAFASPTWTARRCRARAARAAQKGAGPDAKCAAYIAHPVSIRFRTTYPIHIAKPLLQLGRARYGRKHDRQITIF